MSRRKRHPAHANHERWLVSYADFITLMFAFFVVLYASSQVDHRKAGQVAMAIQVAFQKLGIFQTSNTRVALSSSEPMPFDQVQTVENVARIGNLKQIVERMQGRPQPKSSNLADLKKDLEKALAPEIERHTIHIELTPEGLVVSLREIGFFDSGSSTVRPDSEKAVARIASELAPLPYAIRIEGHTDNVPIHTPRFDSNWELSTARATEMIKLFILQYDFPPQRLSAGGYAEFHPVATENTAQGRAMNRRVDLVILPSQPVADPVKSQVGLGAPAISPPKESL